MCWVNKELTLGINYLILAICNGNNNNPLIAVPRAGSAMFSQDAVPRAGSVMFSQDAKSLIITAFYNVS